MTTFLQKLNADGLYLESLLDNIVTNVYWKDCDGRYLGCNKSSALMAGFTDAAEIIGKSDFELPWKDYAPMIRSNDLKVMQHKKTQDLEEIITLNGKQLTFITRKAPLYDEHGQVLGIIGISMDVSERKHLEHRVLSQAKEEAESANRAKSEFIANMSHDIRTPITGILAMADHMLDAAESATDTTPVSDLVKTIVHDTHLLKGSTNELLYLCNEIIELIQLEANQHTDDTTVFSLPALIEHAINLLQPEAMSKQLALSYHIDPQLPPRFKGMRIYLGRVLVNLVSNALKFTTEGFVKIRVSAIKSRAKKEASKARIKIEVEDSGIGIPKSKHQVIFEHFSRLSSSYEGVHKGTGLGLYTVKRYIEAMSGKIKLRSTVGKGSCFTVEVPLVITDDAEDPDDKPLAIPHRTSTAQPLSINSLTSNTPSESAEDPAFKVLIVEDSHAAILGLKIGLKPFHCAVDAATTGAEGITMATQGSYDLILMDIGLPDMSGIQATVAIRKVHPDVPIIAVTGHGGNEDQRQACFDAGMQEVLSKPARTDDLRAFFDELHQQKEQLASIDWVGCLHFCHGDETVAHHMISMLAADLALAEPILAHYQDPKQYPQIRATLHRLRGNISYLKVPELEKRLEDFHEAIRHHAENSDLTAAYQRLQEAVIRFTAERAKLGLQQSLT